ncbi:FRG domain-containing protein [Runella zeae]|uniref:FRG domain-containing protein n=1 Tax=Runella zeae TaxID=94255 RepID=UPI0004010F9E|nr:FRG domain-containing protein [Runella zeae]
MKYKTQTLYNWQEFEAFFSEPGQHFYRGHADETWKLSPTLCRNETDLSKVLKKEKTLLTSFKEEVDSAGLNSHFNFRPGLGCEEKDWHWLFQCQHIGLPTRLLDWTNDFKTALFFAVEGDKDAPQHDDKDGAFWVQYVDWDLTLKDDTFYHIPLERFNESGYANPPMHWNNQISFESASGYQNRFAQKGKFFVFGNDKLLTPLEDLEEFIVNENDPKNPYLTKVIIPQLLKAEFRERLHQMGYNKSSVYRGDQPEVSAVATGVRKKCS